MKKFLLSCFLTAGLLAGLSGCQKMAADVEPEAPSKVQAFFNLTSWLDLKLAYRTLTAGERAEVWSQHLGNIISSGKFSTEQNNRIRELRKVITASLFSTDKRNKPQDAVITNWINKAYEVFTRNEIAQIVADLSFSFPESKQLSVGFTTKADCHCSTQSDWCGSTVYCSKCTGCTAQTLDEEGCGTLWNYTCQGGCISITIPASPGCVN
ncbi:bacteriocin fulvocin C-related protein [Hufsiella ginkgonis]|uniref:Bacteriocin fulvocin C-related protein n=1 Tax=Hufsiella ginkgonis TaxID=2695274 RepID=A0A7K1Y0D5_9SPHI|nr:bacteriocin fulvocin C-related protein [Hufsiella ginkgonis]MXV16469.1 bacteriocin fulvocin C-related protein [Hufsiella ginkgonis]